MSYAPYVNTLQPLAKQRGCRSSRGAWENFPQLFRISRSCNSFKPKGFLPPCYESAHHSNHYVVSVDRLLTTCYRILASLERAMAAASVATKNRLHATPAFFGFFAQT